ncbi:MAG: hypothetical protein R3279_10845 [Putridiphycobacter sp.]|nr:hypothetical protein [Putridiphycobacter sp.]
MVGKLINFFCVAIVVTSLLSFSAVRSEKEMKSSVFKVIKVNGRIIFVKTGEHLNTGDAYVDGTPLEFSTNRDRAAIVNKVRGRYILQPNPKGKAIVLPATSNIEPRGVGSVLLNRLDLKNYFSDTCVFIGDVDIVVGQEAFPLDEARFFYVTYDYKGEKIAKKIRHVNQGLELSEQYLFEIDGKPIPTFNAEMTLYYMKGDIASKISSFYPLFLNQNDLKQEVAVLLEELKDLSTDKKLDEVGTYISEFYGKPQKENLNDWLFHNFGLGLVKEINFK